MDIKEDNRAFLRLAKPERTVADAASRIFAAYIIRNLVNEDNEDIMLEKAVNFAVKLAKIADDKIKTDEEI